MTPKEGELPSNLSFQVIVPGLHLERPGTPLSPEEIEFIKNQSYLHAITWKDKIDGNSPSFGVIITVTCVLAPPHYFLYFPSFLCALWPPVCVGTMAMLPLAGFTHSHCSLG